MAKVYKGQQKAKKCIRRLQKVAIGKGGKRPQKAMKGDDVTR